MTDGVTQRIRLALLVGVAYYIGARVGFALVMSPTPVSTLWPPNAILLAAMLLTPPARWSMVVVAAFIAHLLSELESGVPLVMMLSWFVSNVSQAGLGAAGIRYFGGRGRFDDVRSFAVFLIFGVFLAPFVASFLDAGFVTMIGWGTAGYWDVWRVRFFSNVLTTLTLVPAIIALAGRIGTPLPRAPRRYVEAGALLLALSIATYVVGWGESEVLSQELALAYVPIPVLLWAAVRFGLGGVTGALVIMELLSIESAMFGRGPFVGLSPQRGVLSLQLFMITIAVPLMLLAVVLQERARIEAARRRSEQRYRDVVENQAELICRFLADTTLTFVNERFCRHFDRPRAALIGRRFVEFVPEDARGEVLARAAAAFALPRSDNVCAWELALFSPDGSRAVQVWSGRPIVDPDGRVVEVQASGRDVTAQRLAEQSLRERDEALRTSRDRIQELAGRLMTAQEDERRRIALELHDDVNQKLAAIAIAMSGVRRTLSNAGPQRDAIARLQERITMLTDDIRRLSHQLNPAVLVHAGLIAGLRAYCADFTEDTGIEVLFTVTDETLVVPDATALCLYRVAQEALHNVAQHARSPKARVALRRDEETVELSVRDEGIGFDIDAVRAHGRGLGLIGIEERLRLVHGLVQIVAEPGRGVEIIARAPIGARQLARSA